MRAVNLIPTDERRGAALGAGRSDGAAYGVMAVIAGLAILALIYGISHHQISSRRSQLATTVARTQRAQATVARLTPYTSFIALREQRVQAVSQLVNSRFDWAHAFHELGRVLPHDASISSLDGQIGSTATAGSSSGSTSGPSTSSGSAAGAAGSAGSVTSATPPGSIPTFTLAGCATSQAEVALTLERLRLIDGVGEVSLQSSTKSGPEGSAASGSSAPSAAGTGCPSGTAAFNVEVSFDPLPAAPAASSSSTKLTSTTGAQG